MSGEQKFYCRPRPEAGLDLLREHLKACMGYHGGSAEGTFMARRRHLEALERAATALARAADQLEILSRANWSPRNCARLRMHWRKLPASLRQRICYHGSFPAFALENSKTYMRPLDIRWLQREDLGRDG
jgi:hypothetical protein